MYRTKGRKYRITDLKLRRSRKVSTLPLWRARLHSSPNTTKIRCPRLRQAWKRTINIHVVWFAVCSEANQTNSETAILLRWTILSFDSLQHKPGVKSFVTIIVLVHFVTPKISDRFRHRANGKGREAEDICEPPHRFVSFCVDNTWRDHIYSW